MLFNEIYSCYFNSVAEILKEAVNGTLTSKKMTAIIEEKAFQESHLIRSMLLSGEWALLKKNFKTPLKHIPTQPLTTLQKRWMKSLLLDPRIQLFTPSFEGLEHIKPL